MRVRAVSMRRAFLLPASVLVLLPGLPLPAAGSADAWPFPAEMRSPLAFVHPLVNYAVHPAWQRDWERRLHGANGVTTTVGSVSTEDLFTDLTVNVTEPLSERFRFLYPNFAKLSPSSGLS